ncbi:uncharacterized protein [Gorilla gorilla gorilla]|uniref:uncharacterized protein n=1 Tax=Gorilla gorilla gorilla TaxID=9595 RepID=UPI0024463659|nr:uncharacterized protein LOC109027270 [Gorilla gorilla gorilla]
MVSQDELRAPATQMQLIPLAQMQLIPLLQRVQAVTLGSVHMMLILQPAVATPACSGNPLWSPSTLWKLCSFALHNKPCYRSLFGFTPSLRAVTLNVKDCGFILEVSETTNPLEGTNSGDNRKVQSLHDGNELPLQGTERLMWHDMGLRQRYKPGPAWRDHMGSSLVGSCFIKEREEETETERKVQMKLNISSQYRKSLILG